MLTTIVITPRERYSQYPGSLRSLFSTIRRETRVIVIDANAPDEVRREMRKINKERPFEHIETDEVLLAPQVRNMGLEMIDTKYTCYCDNDLEYTPGWLEKLEQNAETNGSGAVAPLTLTGPSPRPKIHHAGSDVRVIVDDLGRPTIKSHHRLDGTYLDEAISKGVLDKTPRECDEFEYHCVLIRTDVLRAMGGHDEVQTKHDHLDDSLRIKMQGEKITFEPDAVILYRVIAPFKSYDWGFFFYRWSPEYTSMSESRIGEVWGARKNYPEQEMRFLRNHYRRAAGTLLPDWTQKLRPEKIRNLLNAASLVVLNGWIVPLAPKVEFRKAPLPPENGLEIAGIQGAEVIAKFRDQAADQ